MAKNILANKPSGMEYKVVCIGDKSKALMQRLYNKELLFTANEFGRTPPSFQDAAVAGRFIYKLDTREYILCFSQCHPCIRL